MRKTLIAVLSFYVTGAGAWDSNPYAAESAIYKVEVPYGNKVGFGTGVLVASNKILTNCHVVKNKPGWPVVINRNTGRRFNVSKYYNLGNYDACVLVGYFEGTPVPLTADFSVGQNVWHYGYPRGVKGMGQGVIEGVVDTDKGPSILTASFCNPGSSGGPLLNVRGQMLGLHYGHMGYSGSNQCVSIPAGLLIPYLQ